MKCNGCIFLDTFQDMGSSTPVCVRALRRDLVSDIEACEAPGPCPWHITRSEVRDLQGVSSRAPGLSPIDAEVVYAKIQASEKAAESFQSAVVALGESVKPMGRMIVALAEALREAGIDLEVKHK